MDFRAHSQQDNNEMRTSSGSLSYAAATATNHHHLSTKESSPSSAAAAADHIQKRRLGIHNGTGGNYNSTQQTLDHPLPPPHHHPQQQQQQQLPSQPLIRDIPDPDRALSGTPVAPAGGGPKPTSKVVRYRECLKNHAANIGGNVFDGCGEFMPSGDEGTLEALKCAACDCHRNFHRKEVDGETTSFGPGSRRSSIMLSPLQLPPPLPSPSSALHHHHHHHHQKFSLAPIIQPMNVAFGSSGAGGGGGTESSSDDLNVFQSEGGGVAVPPFSLSKKRFRTKFTVEQKERMMEFAEKVGWRIQKQDEEEVERFCAEVGVRRQVLRVWMHNNKNSAVKSKNDFPTAGGAATTSLSFENVDVDGGGGGGGGGATADDDA